MEQGHGVCNPGNLPPQTPGWATSRPLQRPGNLFEKTKKKAKPSRGLVTLHTSSSPLCRCTARKTRSPSRGSNNKYFPMQETQCDKFGVSGGLGEPRFGLKLWLGSADLIDDNSSKSWVLFRDLPYLAIVMGVDLCMFMSVGIAHDQQTKTRWRDESLASAAAGASVPRILKGGARGGDGQGAARRKS